MKVRSTSPICSVSTQTVVVGSIVVPSLIWRNATEIRFTRSKKTLQKYLAVYRAPLMEHAADQMEQTATDNNSNNDAAIATGIEHRQQTFLMSSFNSFVHRDRAWKVRRPLRTPNVQLLNVLE